MSRGRGHVRTASIVVGDVDEAIINAVRAEHGLSFNAAVRYCIRRLGVELTVDRAERKRKIADLASWLEETKAHRRPGARE